MSYLNPTPAPGVGFTVSVAIDLERLVSWEPDQVRALMAGIAKVLNVIPDPSLPTSPRVKGSEG